MIKLNLVINKPVFVIGDIVSIAIPKVDRFHKLSFPNLIGKIVKYFPQINKYQVYTSHGKLHERLSPYDMQRCPNIAIDFVESSVEISLRAISRILAYETKGCKCSGRCQNNVCFCKKMNKFCNVAICQHTHKSVCVNVDMTRNTSTRSKRVTTTKR